MTHFKRKTHYSIVSNFQQNMLQILDARSDVLKGGKSYLGVMCQKQCVWAPDEQKSFTK